MRLAKFFAGQSAAPAAGSPVGAVGGVEKGFQSRDAGGYYADCCFQT